MVNTRRKILRNVRGRLPKKVTLDPKMSRWLLGKRVPGKWQLAVQRELTEGGEEEKEPGAQRPRFRHLVWEAVSRIWGFILRARMGLLKGWECVTRFKF